MQLPIVPKGNWVDATIFLAMDIEKHERLHPPHYEDRIVSIERMRSLGISDERIEEALGMKIPKGVMMSSSIEFEQKFVLDLRKSDQIAGDLSIRSLSAKHTITSIRQYYTKNGERFRSSQTMGSPVFVKETKRSMKIGTVYSISVEEEIIITEEIFEDGWKKNNTRRLQKIRYGMPGRHPEHNVIVDFFYTTQADIGDNNRTYAIIAEAETMLTAQTKELYLQFQLPIYLEKYLLVAVDDNDPAMKIFKSTNLVDIPENIEAVKRAISNLYGTT